MHFINQSVNQLTSPVVHFCSS